MRLTMRMRPSERSCPKNMLRNSGDCTWMHMGTCCVERFSYLSGFGMFRVQAAAVWPRFNGELRIDSLFALSSDTLYFLRPTAILWFQSS